MGWLHAFQAKQSEIPEGYEFIQIELAFLADPTAPIVSFSNFIYTWKTSDI